MKLTPKQEMFAKKYVELGSQTEAYKCAYNYKKMLPASINRKAKEVYDNVNVAARILELRKYHAKRHDMTIDDLINELEEARQIGAGAEQAGAMVSATMGKAKLLRLDQDVAVANEALRIEIVRACKK